MTVRAAYGPFAQPAAAAEGRERDRLNLEQAVVDLFETARDDVYRYLLTLNLAPGQAQDATQEVFLRLYSALRNGQRIENLRAWVFRVAHNHGLTLRGQERAFQPIGDDWEVAAQDPSGNPERAALEKERWRRFHDAVQSLSAQQRQCLHLRAEGFRYREIASILGISDSTVGEFLRRAITRLRKVLDA